MALGAFLVLPWTRRVLYNNTLGRFRSVEGIAKACEGRVGGLKSTLGEVQGQAKELAERARVAEEEMRCAPAHAAAAAPVLSTHACMRECTSGPA